MTTESVQDALQSSTRPSTDPQEESTLVVSSGEGAFLRGLRAGIRGEAETITDARIVWADMTPSEQSAALHELAAGAPEYVELIEAHLHDFPDFAPILADERELIAYVEQFDQEHGLSVSA